MSLRDLIDSDSLNVFCNANEFAENVTYVPHRYFGDEARANRPIVAVVFREGIATVPQDVEATSPVFEVHVHNNSSTGISSEELDLGGDAISFPPRDGQSASTRQVTRLLSQDHGMLVLECR